MKKKNFLVMGSVFGCQIDMLRTKINVSTQFLQSDRFGGGVVSSVRGRAIAPAYRRALRRRSSVAMYDSMRAFDRVVLNRVLMETPIRTGWLYANTRSSLGRFGSDRFLSQNLRWSLVADTYYAVYVNRRRTRRRRPNYFGRAVNGAVPLAMQSARREFANSLS